MSLKSSQNINDHEFIYIQMPYLYIRGFPAIKSQKGSRTSFNGRKNGCSEGNLLICLQVSTVCVFDRQNMLVEALNTSRTLFT